MPLRFNYLLEKISKAQFKQKDCERREKFDRTTL